MCFIQCGLVISCKRTCSAVGAARIWQRWVAVCNLVGFMVCLRNSQWWCLLIILIPSKFAKGIFILYNPPFMLNIPILLFWANCVTVREAMAVCRLYFIDCFTIKKKRKGCEMASTSEYIYIQTSQAVQVIEVGGVWVGVLSASHGSYQDVLWHCFHFVWCSQNHGLHGVNMSLPRCHHTSTHLQRFICALSFLRIRLAMY